MLCHGSVGKAANEGWGFQTLLWSPHHLPVQISVQPTVLYLPLGSDFSPGTSCAPFYVLQNDQGLSLVYFPETGLYRKCQVNARYGKTSWAVFLCLLVDAQVLFLISAAVWTGAEIMGCVEATAVWISCLYNPVISCGCLVQSILLGSGINTKWIKRQLQYSWVGI